MTFSLILIGLSLALFAYWFRYSCLLILRTQTAEDYAVEVSRANGLSFDLVKGQLEANQNTNLDELCSSLERDYQIVRHLLDQVPASALDENVLQSKLLCANFRVTQIWFRASRALGLPASVNALEEMAETIAHFANRFGEYNATRSTA